MKLLNRNTAIQHIFGIPGLLDDNLNVYLVKLVKFLQSVN